MALPISRHKGIFNKHLNTFFLFAFEYRRNKQVNKVNKGISTAQLVVLGHFGSKIEQVNLSKRLYQIFMC